MPPRARNAWFRTLGLLALVLAAGLAVGLLVGKPWPALTVAALGVVAWHYWKLRGVLLRLTARQRTAPPEGEGVWNELDRLLHRGQQDMRSRKRRLLDMLRAYRAAAAALPDAVVIVDRDSQRVVWFNEAATPLLGLRHPRDIDRALGDCLQPLPVSRWLAAGRNAEPMIDAVSPTDPAIRLNLRLIPYSEELWLLVARDVTKLMRLEEMRRDFVANVSHELRTPLTVLFGQAEILTLDLASSGSPYAPQANEIRQHVLNTTRLVNNLLDMARIQSGGFNLNKEWLTLEEVVGSALRMLEPGLNGRQIKLALPDPLMLVFLDGPLFERVLINLLENAVKYAGNEAEIGITASTTHDSLQLDVWDSGPGIPSGQEQQIFAKFSRGHKESAIPGVGLGLAICQAIVDIHGGTLSASNRPEGGACFRVTLPREKPPELEEAPEDL